MKFFLEDQAKVCVQKKTYSNLTQRKRRREKILFETDEGEIPPDVERRGGVGLRCNGFFGGEYGGWIGV